MMKPDRINPRFYILNNYIHSDKCIWCLEKETLTKSHLIPEFLGSKFYTMTTCKKCNSYLGREIESKAKKNAFISSALSKLKITSKKEAYRHSRKFDTETGVEMHITEDGVSKVIPKKLSDSQFIGSLEEIEKFRTEEFKKEKPNWPVKPIEDFFADEKQTFFKYAGKKYTKKIYNQGKGELKIVQSRDINPEFIFKIVYEFLAINQFQNHIIFEDIFNNYVDVNLNLPNRLTFSKEINKRILPNTSVAFKKYRNLEEIPFRHYHYISFKLSKDLILYIDVTLFGQLKILFIIGKFTKYDDRISPLIDNVFIFQNNQSNIVTEIFPNVEMKDIVIWCDASVEYQFRKFEN